MSRGSTAVRIFGVAVLIVCLVRISGSSPSSSGTWEAKSGNWTIGPGRLEASAAGLALTSDWYASGSLRGVAELGTSPTGLILRYAGATENYELRLEPATRSVILRAHHQNETYDAIRMASPWPLRRVRFRVEMQGRALNGWIANDRDPAQKLLIEFGQVDIPEGRFGLRSDRGPAVFEDVQVEGRTESTFTTYAFHCNYRLPEKLAKEPLWQYLDAQGSALLARYPKRFSSAQEFERYRRDAVLRIRRSIGLDPWPERNPLRSRVVGTVDKNDYRIEKVIFESQPGFLVNALIYIPKKLQGRAPAILSTIGHYGDDGFFLWSEQARCIGLARKGYVVLTYDPIGQGERKWLGNGVHDRLRRKNLLVGMDVSGLMFWDSIRAIDYLVSRPEVDPERIGVTGVSGGGFNALYTAVLDERVKAVAPAGFATTIEALIKRGSAGCCAYVRDLSTYAGMEDVYSLIAPRKMLIMGGYMDILADRILPIYEAAHSAYALHAADSGVRYYLDRDAGHTYSKPMRLELYRWFGRWLKDVHDAAEAREPRDSEDLLISRDSGVLKVFAEGERGRDVIELERDFFIRHRNHPPLPLHPADLPRFQRRIREGLTLALGPAPPCCVRLVERRRESSRNIGHEQVVLETEAGIPVTVEVRRPEGPRAGMVIFFSLDQPADATPGTADTIRRLIAAGNVVAIPQARGSGATHVADMNSVMLFGLALGKHLYSGRVYDLQRVLDFLLDQPEFQKLPVTVWGEGLREGSSALVLGAIDARVSAVVSSRGLANYQHIVDRDLLPDFDHYPPAVLLHTDLPQVATAIAPRTVIISSPAWLDGASLSSAERETVYRGTEMVFKAAGDGRQFHVVDDMAAHEALRSVSRRRTEGAKSRVNLRAGK